MFTRGNDEMYCAFLGAHGLHMHELIDDHVFREPFHIFSLLQPHLCCFINVLFFPRFASYWQKCGACSKGPNIYPQSWRT